MRDQITGGAATTDSTDPRQVANPHHLASIDALRGLAALSVVVFHTVLIPQPTLAVPAAVRFLILSGGTGVQLFFVISAFTLCLSWHARNDGRSRVRKFYLRRAFRILPLFYCWLALSLVRDDRMFHLRHSLREIALNATVLFNLQPGKSTGIVWASWTIGVEVLFYVLFPVLAGLATRVRRAVLGVTVAAVGAAAFCAGLARSTVPVATQDMFMRTSLAMAMPVFLVGILVYAVHAAAANRPIARGLAMRALVPVAVIAFVTLAYVNAFDGTRVGPDWSAVPWALLVTGLIAGPFPLLVNAVTRFYGRISYSLYLNHPTIVLLLTPVYRELYRLPGATLPLILCIIVTLGCMTPVAYLTYKLIEQPGIRLGSRIIRRC